MIYGAVLQRPLVLFSKEPMTGFYRNGYCDAGPDDPGNHSVAGIYIPVPGKHSYCPGTADISISAELTDSFLDFSASRGNNLRSIGLKHGCKWCLCAGRWKEALNAAKGDQDPVVPKVWLESTHDEALKSVGLEELKRFAITDRGQGGREM